MRPAFEIIPKDFISKAYFFEHTTLLTEALTKIEQNGAVIVMKNNDYYGVVDDRAISRGNIKIKKTNKIGTFAVKLPPLENETSIEKAIYTFYTSQAKALPYIENKKVLGIIKRETILKAILSLHMTSKLTAADIMSTPVMAIESDASVASAKVFMEKNKINRLAVSSNGALNGIITYKDILKNTATLDNRVQKDKDRIIKSSKVEEVSSTNPFTINYDEGVDDAIRNMVENNISSLLVTRNGKTVGVITVRDIFESIAKSAAPISENIIISGLDDYTKEYESEIRTELEKFNEKVQKFHKLNVENILLNVKRHKSKNYELHMRVWLGKRGVVSHGVTGFTLDKALSDLISTVYDTIKEKKETVYMKKTLIGRYDEE